MPAPSSTAITDFFALKIHINLPKGGFSEEYPLVSAVQATALADAKRICSFRADLFSAGMAIVSASVSAFTKFKDRYIPRGYRYQPINLATEALITDVAPCNDYEAGPLWRLDTGLGKFANRCIRGLRDSWITNNAAVTTSWTPDTKANTDAYAAPTPNVTTQQQVIDRFLNTIFWYTQHVQITGKTDYVNGLRTMTGFGKLWNAIEYRKLSSRDVGQRFGLGTGKQPNWS